MVRFYPAPHPAMSRKLWNQLKGNKSEYPVDWDKMYDAVRNASHRLPPDGNPRKKRFFRLERIVAVCTLLLLAAGAYFFFAPLPDNNRATYAQQADPSPPGNTRTVHLPDGSTVVLFDGSLLDYPADFHGDTREVNLTGHGYFDIAKNPSKPFIVHTGKLSTRVLGTAFYIRAFPADDSIEVKVKRGKVQVLNEKRTLGMITANEIIAFSKRTEQHVQHVAERKVQANAEAAETHFDNITLAEAALRIEEWFLADIEFSNEAARDCLITATFSPDDTLEEVLTVVCGVIRANFTMEQNKIVIDGSGCRY